MILAVLLPTLLWAQPRSPGAGGSTDSSRTGEESEQKKTIKIDRLQRYREALELLGTSSNNQEIARASKILRYAYSASRPLLVEAVRSGTTRARVFAVKLIGEKGKGRKDREVVASALKDQDAEVRLAAVRAIQNLGKKGCEDLKNYLPDETEPRNRKMAVRVLEGWGDPDAIPLLVRLLKKETNSSARHLIVSSLEKLSGDKLGKDVEAWESYAEEYVMAPQRADLLRLAESRSREREKETASGDQK